MSGPLRFTFLTSADTIEHLPPTAAEVALVGRSNVGKSSLLNALAGQKHLAKTSKSPGRTRLLNCFELAAGATLVDCPGYGYASAPAQMRGSWKKMMETYLQERDELRMILVLVDGEIGPTPLDVQMLEWLQACGLPWTVIATKHDKVKSAKREKRKKDLAIGCGISPGDVVWVSAAKGVGIDRLRGLVRGWLADQPA